MAINAGTTLQQIRYLLLKDNQTQKINVKIYNEVTKYISGRHCLPYILLPIAYSFHLRT
jgi:hypothetical protein